MKTVQVKAVPAREIEKASAVFGMALRVSAQVSCALTALFAYLDRALWASVTGKVLSRAWFLGEAWGSGSFIVRKVWAPLGWPLVRLVVAPWGERLEPETLLGLALAAACAFPTELTFMSLAAALCVTLWVRVKEARYGGASLKMGRAGIGALGAPDPRPRLWVFPEFGTTAAFALVFIFLLGATLASALPRASVVNFVIWCFYGLAFFMAADAAARGKAELVIWPFLSGATFSALVAVYQKVSGWVPPRSWLDKRFEEDIVRYVGTFTNPTFFAEMLGLALPLTVALLLRKRDWRDRSVLLAFAGIQGIGMLLSYSRGAWLGLIVSLAVLAVLCEKRMLIVGLIVGALLLSVAPPVLVDRLLSSFSLEDSSNSYRIFIWRGSVAMLRKYLFRGVGLGAEPFVHVYPEFMIVQTPAPHAHSLYLQMLIEIGLFGFLAMAWFFMVWGWDVLGVLFREQGGWAKRWQEIGALAGAFAAVAGHMLQGVIEHTWYNPRVTLAFWAVMGIASGLVLGKRMRARHDERSRGPLPSAETGGAGE